MDHNLQIAILTLLSVLVLVWIGIIAAVAFVAWRLRKVFFAVSMAIRTITAVSNQLADLSGGLGRAKNRFEKRAG